VIDEINKIQRNYVVVAAVSDTANLDFMGYVQGDA